LLTEARVGAKSRNFPEEEAEFVPFRRGQFTVCESAERNPLGSGEEVYNFDKINALIADDGKLRDAGLGVISSCLQAR
jgi:hypothetical protein